MNSMYIITVNAYNTVTINFSQVKMALCAALMHCCRLLYNRRLAYVLLIWPKTIVLATHHPTVLTSVPQTLC